jgi:hypothetical protein
MNSVRIGNLEIPIECKDNRLQKAVDDPTTAPGTFCYKRLIKTGSYPATSPLTHLLFVDLQVLFP